MSLSGKNILVTGADGFIGGHLVETLVSFQWDAMLGLLFIITLLVI